MARVMRRWACWLSCALAIETESGRREDVVYTLPLAAVQIGTATRNVMSFTASRAVILEVACHVRLAFAIHVKC